MLHALQKEPISILYSWELPKRPIAISDYKNTEFPQACIETFSYSTRLMEKRFEDDNYAVQLVFPATREWISWSYI